MHVSCSGRCGLAKQLVLQPDKLNDICATLVIATSTYTEPLQDATSYAVNTEYGGVSVEC
jgi:hypothetical protein